VTGANGNPAFDDATIDALAGRMEAADSVVALTGAGVSTASGIPDFRSDGGIWDQFDPADFHRRRFDADPVGFWSDRIALRETLLGDGEVAPNAAHEALATLESAGYLDVLLTQNVDGLHRRAGSDAVVELHGSNARVACEGCGARFDAAPAFERARSGVVPPRCRDCEGVLKPDVVLFGESLPGEALERARSAARDASVFLAVGSSLQVQPAARLPAESVAAGARLAVVNLDSTPVDDRAAHVVRADVTAVLPALEARLVE
jgi:NAD-dependent deacetylase